MNVNLASLALPVLRLTFTLQWSLVFRVHLNIWPTSYLMLCVAAVIMGLGPAIYALLILPRTSYNPLLFHLPFWW